MCCNAFTCMASLCYNRPTMAENTHELKTCRLESCGKQFQPTVSWQDFCTAEHRQLWNAKHYCGHRRPIAECEVEGCEARALYEKVKMFETRFSQCRCGRWFERKQVGMKHCGAECRYAAKHEAEKKRRSA